MIFLTYILHSKMFIIYKIWINLLNLYKQIESLLGDFNEIILKTPGNKFIPKGYNKDNPKLINVSFKRYICVFLYTAQKHEI